MNQWAVPGQPQKPKAIGIEAVGETRHVVWRGTADHRDRSDFLRQERATSQRIRNAPRVSEHHEFFDRQGIGKVVYASEHWVVKRERSAKEIIALILVWKLLRRIAGQRLLRRPSRWIRFLRVVMQGMMSVIPRSLWFSTHAFAMWKVYRSRDKRGERIARATLKGTGLLPARVTFPPTRVEVGGWPGWLRTTYSLWRLGSGQADRAPCYGG